MQQVVVHEPAIANAVRCLPLLDQLELTLQLLQQDDWQGTATRNCGRMLPEI
jgi:hypothetical protein